jgi:hypothetical protein
LVGLFDGNKGGLITDFCFEEAEVFLVHL